MYTEHEPSGGGGGKPEQMDIEVSIVLMPMFRFKGGCDECQKAARGAMNKLLIIAMSESVSTFKRVMERGRGECSVELASEQTTEHMMREKFGNELTDKILELSRG